MFKLNKQDEVGLFVYLAKCVRYSWYVSIIVYLVK